MNRHQKNISIGVALVVVATLATWVFYRLERSHQRAVAEVSAGGAALPELAPPPSADLPVSIYFYSPDPENPGNPQLQSRLENIAAADEPIQRAQQIVNAVLKSSRVALPPQARVRQVFLLEDGTAIVDLSRECAEQLNGGVTSELGLLASITRSLTENLLEIKQVRFLVEGAERPAFSGHVSIQRPFL